MGRDSQKGMGGEEGEEGRLRGKDGWADRGGTGAAGGSGGCGEGHTWGPGRQNPPGTDNHLFIIVGNTPAHSIPNKWDGAGRGDGNGFDGVR